MTGKDQWVGGFGRRKGRRQEGSERSGWHRCPTCRGDGVLPGIVKTQGLGKGMGSQFGPCPECDGFGWLRTGVGPDVQPDGDGG